MTRRTREHIPMIEIAASALADKLDPAWRAIWQAEGRSARYVVDQFTPDHIALHCWKGPDIWWNLDMRRRGPELKAKDRADTSRAAKARRIDEKWGAFTRAMAAGKKPLKRKSKWPKRKMIGRANDKPKRKR